MSMEEKYLEIALDYKKKYELCSWWKFKERNDLYKSWQDALNLMIRYSK